jgi:uncharacterized protein YjbJ (UPF0337 family)
MMTSMSSTAGGINGKIQQRYGFAKDQAKKDIDDWFAAQGW